MPERVVPVQPDASGAVSENEGEYLIAADTERNIATLKYIISLPLNEQIDLIAQAIQALYDPGLEAVPPKSYFIGIMRRGLADDSNLKK